MALFPTVLHRSIAGNAVMPARYLTPFSRHTCYFADTDAGNADAQDRTGRL